ncbi:magnesium/cobalt transporter CorA [Desulfofustis glycolicus]|uniref:Magnesium transport protein CorA n=1 Tax=Desulfofustis glycolicus DSM 9705 TaxID=1121409 RepID=A0A1M5XS05_9BACT|nr:magnesium/cobalt transporter CorA [Desulfofustis glycolicus]MCB2217846.1 magnesium/cobalt transporter CorA [Desulfobulbaceae bacterium]SHI02328.1 magnesium transporter [Desulfofustis glycolicus DSM 9705]
MSPSTKKKRRPRGSGIKTGMSPGTMVFIGEQKQDRARIEVLAYSEATFDELHDIPVEQCRPFANAPGVSWINVNGIHDVGLIQALGSIFGLHPLTLEDLVNTGQRLKIEEFPSYTFIVLKMITFNETTQSIDVEHVSLILGERFVLSFQEDAGDVFGTVRERLRSAKGRLRSMKADYLAYSLMDAVVDHYFLAVERIGERIEDLDERSLIEPRPEDIGEIHRLKRVILMLRKAAWPLREEIGALEKSELAMVRPETRLFWRDLYDHTIQILEMADTYRDILGGMHDTFLSSMSNRMNEIMKVLTIIATIFIPLTFIAGVYGMNFVHMPELQWRWGYHIVWGIMLIVGCGLLAYFKRKKWL